MGKKTKKTKRKHREEGPIPPDTSNKSLKVLHIRDHSSTNIAEKTLCLAQRLKKYRGTASSTPPPPIWRNGNFTHKKFLTAQDDPLAFEDCLKTSYSGFRYDSPSSLPEVFHKTFESSFEGLDELYLYDIVQPGKKRLTRTSVTRTLVGEPGSTYKYLGLRLFSHPWTDIDDEGNASKSPISPLECSSCKSGASLCELGYSSKIASALIGLGRANLYLIDRSNNMLQKNISLNVSPIGLVGSAEYNLTLINKMASSSLKRDLNQELTYGMGRISVGWHRDSGLKDFSSIAVYQMLKDSSISRDNWGVALRAMDGGAGGPLTSVPAVMVPLPSGSLYYLFDDFNHNHEHAVIAGSHGVRYSSTHRVAREGQGSWQYIRDKIDRFFISASKFKFNPGAISNDDWSGKSNRSMKEDLVKFVRTKQILMNEIEFEWLHQWCIQGKKHASLHFYWHEPIEILCKSFCRLEKMSIDLLHLMRETSVEGSNVISEDLFDVFIESFSERAKLSNLWTERYLDSVFKQIPEDERPSICKCLRRDKNKTVEECLRVGCLPEVVDELISQIRHWRSTFVQNKKAVVGSKSHKTSTVGILTRKEQKKVASNWEVLKRKL